eukprot:2992444-Alexandrium_andersonii.AAC.1
MSASLVGSEMCIRDSAHPATARLRAPPQPREAPPTGRKVPSRAWARPSRCLLYTSDAADDM